MYVQANGLASTLYSAIARMIVLPGGKDAMPEVTPRENGEPELDLIEPRCMGGSEVQPDVLVLIQPRHDAGMRVSRQIIDDQMQLPTLIGSVKLLEEVQKLRMRLAPSSPSHAPCRYALAGRQTSSPPRSACTRPRAV